MSAEIEDLGSYIRTKEVIKQKLIDEIEEWNKKITQYEEDSRKKNGEMQQNVLQVTAIMLQFSKSTAVVSEEDKLKREAKIKQFFDVIEKQKELIERYVVDILIFNENKAKAQAELAEVEAQIERLKEVEKYVSTPIDTGDLDLSHLNRRRSPSR